MEKFYRIGDIDYELYQAASGDWCVTVSEFGKEDNSYNLGTYEKALEFILSDSELPVE